MQRRKCCVSFSIIRKQCGNAESRGACKFAEELSTQIVFGGTIKLAREGVAQPVAGSGVPPRLRGLNRKPPNAAEELSYLVLGFR
jgi:hypothetical protein